MSNTSPRFSLPGQWGRVDLATEASSRRSIRRLVNDVVGNVDQLATLRADLRTRFQAAADPAREGGATSMFVAIELAKGIPLPAWAVVFEPEIESTDFDALGLSDLKTFLEQGITTTDPAVTSADVSGLAIQAVRHSWRRTAQLDPSNEDTKTEMLEVDYWLAAANPNRIAMITFSTGYAEFEEQMLALFDAVISTIRWEAPQPQPVAH
ncbi:hypothetical protein [Salinibacterium sp. M195]|uniref:hypothetical protein n=1 Tax=Salinibacterium sp. M195 TaxID=2583374 RepID=UPI001C62A2D2|nr:hypothetical protein [Salinibacterium sp. M195]QYH35713.1 hypothetical protein FFT87_06945 [Salinibacterium sp. M195]